jgi:hypothetical protein
MGSMNSTTKKQLAAATTALLACLHSNQLLRLSRISKSSRVRMRELHWKALPALRGDRHASYRYHYHCAAQCL